jgi:hypothetical protein
VQKEKGVKHHKCDTDKKLSEHDAEANGDTDVRPGSRRTSRSVELDRFEMLTPNDDRSVKNTIRVDYYWKERLEEVRFVYTQCLCDG